MLATLDRAPGVRWSACVRDAGTSEVLDARRADEVQRTASVGKLLLLVALARRGELAARVSQRSADAVGDSGLWQHLQDVDELSVRDAAVLVGAVSDNLATNALLAHVGLEAVQGIGAELGLPTLELLDLVRDERGPEQPPTLSRGSANDLSAFFALAHQRRLHDRAVSEQVLAWLAPGADLSMVGAAFGLDPLAHAAADRGIRLWSKTGTDTCIRADTGLLTGPGSALSYAVLAEWDGPADRRDEVLTRMREVGEQLRATVA